MRFPISLVLAAAWLARAQTGDGTLKIGPVKTTVNLEGQAVEIAVWGTARAEPAGVFHLAMTADLGDLQDHLTAVLAAQLNRSERCGERMTVERAVVTPSEPAAALTANLHYERYACVKALGKEVVKKLAGGDAVVEARLTPSIGENGIAVEAEVGKIDADGLLGDLLRSGALGNWLREKIASSIESAAGKAVDLKTMLPTEMGSATKLGSAWFADGGSGRLWLTLSGEVRPGAGQLPEAAKEPAR